MAVSTGEVFAHTPALVKTWDMTEETPKGTIAVQSGIVGVTLTDTVGVAKPDEVIYGDVKITGITQPGAGNAEAIAVGDFAAGVAIDGTWEFEEIVSSGTTPVPTSTAQNTPVFITSGGALTLVSTSNTRVGVVNYPGTYSKAAGKLPIAIGL